MVGSVIPYQQRTGGGIKYRVVGVLSRQPVNLILTNLGILKNIILLKDLGQYRSSTFQLTIKLLWAMNIYLAPNY